MSSERSGRLRARTDIPISEASRAEAVLAVFTCAASSRAVFVRKQPRLPPFSDPPELSRLRKALLDYCRQDTLGIVRLLEKMRSP